MSDTHNIGDAFLNVKDAIDLIIDIWRIKRRIDSSDSIPDSVRIACDTAVDRLLGLGFRTNDFKGEFYNDNLRIRVIEQTGGDHNQVISECLSPAVYYKDVLIKPADVILQGEE